MSLCAPEMAQREVKDMTSTKRRIITLLIAMTVLVVGASFAAMPAAANPCSAEGGDGGDGGFVGGDGGDGGIADNDFTQNNQQTQNGGFANTQNSQQIQAGNCVGGDTTVDVDNNVDAGLEVNL